ncbi:hypothetical protein QBC40DRAFT_290624 [Triangularia verruculosa]|uniref:Uncharacterized protein n=1 Tax=Triangularia verruculosa TaxID=2587418 RepID=A0AAN6X9H2_9PEZI|nr:hypothetical protein QBC40DRAFT_290624 [Triangularia verruculosa]
MVSRPILPATQSSWLDCSSRETYRPSAPSEPENKNGAKLGLCEVSEDDTTSKPDSETQKSRSALLRGWLPEILAQLGGLLCLIAIFLLLWHADNRPPEALYLGVTLNTVLAFLTSLAKVAFLVPIAEGLAQLKWIWFSSPLGRSTKPRPLVDFQVFDDAMRGGIGGMRLLFGFKGMLASFGALIMLSGLFTSTLTQQAITYQVEKALSLQANDTATVDRATTFSTYDGNVLALTPYDTLREQRAIFDGIFTPSTERVPEVRANCSSGDCTWPAYGSLAVCSGVANLSAINNPGLHSSLRNATEKRLRLLLQTSNITAGSAGYGNFYMAINEVFPVIIGLLDRPTGAFNQSVTELMVSDSFIAYTEEMVSTSSDSDALDDMMAKVKYLELAFWWCTKSYVTEVTQGQSVTTEVSVLSRAKEGMNNTLNVAWDHSFYPCYSAGRCNETYGGTEMVLEKPAETAEQVDFTVHLWTSLTASMLIASTMLDSLLLDRTRGVVASNGGGSAKAFAFSLLGDFLTTELPPPEKRLADVQTVMSNAARSMTNLVRQGTTRMFRSEAVVQGRVYTSQAFVKIRWEWMGMLTTQLVLTALFLALTAAATYMSRVQVIKSSSLATLCALDEDTRRDLGGLGDGVECLEKMAKKMLVRVERSAGLEDIGQSDASGPIARLGTSPQERSQSRTW